MRLKVSLLICALALEIGHAQELRVGPVTTLPVGLGYSHPQVGGTIAADLAVGRLWITGQGIFQNAGKQDGEGEGFQVSTLGVGSVRIYRGLFLGGGVASSYLKVQAYDKSALRPLFQVSGWNRGKLFYVRLIVPGDDHRNHLAELGGGVRLPLSRGWVFEPYWGVDHFTGTDKPQEKHLGMQARVTLTKTLGRL